MRDEKLCAHLACISSKTIAGSRSLFLTIKGKAIRQYDE
jgi:hypothetical protein